MTGLSTPTETADVTTVEGDDGGGDDGPSSLGRFDRAGDGAIGFRDVLGTIAAFNDDRRLGGQAVALRDVLAVVAGSNEDRGVCAGRHVGPASRRR